MNPESGRIEQADLAARYAQVRGATEALTQGLTAEDCVLQSMPDYQSALADLLNDLIVRNDLSYLHADRILCELYDMGTPMLHVLPRWKSRRL